MTAEIATAAKELIAKIDQMGGAVAGIEAGFQKSEIEKSAYRISQEIESGNRVVVGVNAFVEVAVIVPLAPLIAADVNLT